MKNIKALSMVGLCVLLLTACGTENSNQKSSDAAQSSSEISKQEDNVGRSSTEESSVSSVQSQEIPNLGLNEPSELYFDNSTEPVAEVSLTEVTDNPDAFPDYLRSTDYYDVNNLILIKVEYTNVAFPENIAFGLHDFQVFSADGKQLPNIGQQNGGDPVAPGRTATSEFYVETEEQQNTIELDLIPEGANSPIVTYSVDVEH